MKAIYKDLNSALALPSFRPSHLRLLAILESAQEAHRRRTASYVFNIVVSHVLTIPRAPIYFSQEQTFYHSADEIERVLHHVLSERGTSTSTVDGVWKRATADAPALWPADLKEPPSFPEVWNRLSKYNQVGPGKALEIAGKTLSRSITA